MTRTPAALLLIWSAAVVFAARPGAAHVDRARAVQARHLSSAFHTPRYADGAPAGFSGAFGEDSCHACHFHAEINSKPGQVAIEGVPAQFAAGMSYPLTVTLGRPGMRLAGFQLTARFKDGGAQAGTLALAPGDEARMKIDERDGVQYVNQRRAGTSTSDGIARWRVVWTAPASGGVIQFHVAANAADQDESSSGDYVFTAVAESAPAPR